MAELCGSCHKDRKYTYLRCDSEEINVDHINILLPFGLLYLNKSPLAAEGGFSVFLGLCLLQLCQDTHMVKILCGSAGKGMPFNLRNGRSGSPLAKAAASDNNYRQQDAPH